jgi:7-cyano-7-deazaguanine synthase in queuosine biosynthesis
LQYFRNMESCDRRYIDVNIENIYKDIKSKLTSDENKTYNGVSEWYVPGRNTLFLSIAYAYAEYYDVDRIWIGCNLDDSLNLFPDCTQEYIIKANEFFKLAGSKQVKIEAPLLGYTKEAVLENLTKKYKVDLKKIFSGYGEI